MIQPLATPTAARPPHRARAWLAGTAAGLVAACQPGGTAADPCASPANEIVAENCLEGHPPTEWDINGYGDPEHPGVRHGHRDQPG
ncbi:hypothetical protein [Candidatus Palauibacter sp.]|uniref:hypothetical protein n=1 Tax=Candidatus Palauibacter sp. TaxID=3101350 RepID=UPI003AF24007